MSLYAGANRERLIQISTDLVATAPVRNSKPHFQVSPRTAQGLPTQGIGLTLIPPVSGPAIEPGGDSGDSGEGSGGNGFGFTIWRCVPVLGTWAELAPFTALAHYGEQYVLPDISGGWGLYFQVTGLGESDHGRILVGIAEMD
jgi:hypothetical protein